MSAPLDPPSIQRSKPTAVVVLAILHLVGGSLDLLITLGSLAMSAASKGQGGLGAANARQLGQALETIPAYHLVVGVQIGLNILLDVMLLSAGFGLLGLRPWARTLSLVYAPLSIVLRILSTVWTVVWMMPVMTAVLQEQMGGNPQAGPILEVAQYVGVCFSLVFLAYPIVVLVILTRPAIVAAFRGEMPSFLPQDDLDEPRPVARPEGIQRPDDRIT